MSADQRRRTFRDCGGVHFAVGTGKLDGDLKDGNCLTIKRPLEYCKEHLMSREPNLTRSSSSAASLDADAPSGIEQPVPQATFAQAVFGEFLGTLMLVLFGCGAVHAAVLTGAQSGLWQVAIVWGVAIMLAIYTIGALSGAHINPAITLALAVWGRFQWARVLPYIAVQLLGAFAAAAILYGIYGGFLAAKEREKQVVRGEPGSEVTAMCYCEYFPNPGPLAAATGPYNATAAAELKSLVSQPVAFGAEVLGTAILALLVFALTDERNCAAPLARLSAVFIGLTVAALISIIAPLTQACFNPARDFGPRLFAYFAGWGTIALPGASDWGWLTVYIVAPCVGAVIGAGIYQSLLRPK
jgi:glycerol uptake facilitator protein